MMKISKVFFVLCFLVVLPVFSFAENKVQPVSITRAIKLQIPVRNQFQVIQEWNEETSQDQQESAVGVKEEKTELNYKVTLCFPKGQFSQIKEQVYQGNKMMSEEDLSMLPDDKKIVRNFRILKKSLAHKRIIYTFLSI
ncbi:MAG: hypothetical protein JW928_08030 [Candidatus Aureabacteria bacterium]|nr:hypothetical protein [Candidatus Auribacterota bacterium]